MGKELAEHHAVARRTFEEADDALGYKLSQLCFEGPEDQLRLTEVTQPAILTASVAAWRVLQEKGLRPAFVAGHSLGEYAAHVAAGTLNFTDAVRTVRQRGKYMQEAVPVGVGAMAAVIGMDPEAIAGVAADAAPGEICAVANLNGPAQTVLAGHKGAIDRAVALARERGARKATLLAVSAPFHSPLMRPAREGLAPLLAATPFEDPRVPVVSNVDAVPVASGDAAREALVRQIDSPVRWVESVRWMEEAAGVEVFVEVGPGNVLAGLTRRIVQGARTTAVADPDHLRQLLIEDD